MKEAQPERRSGCSFAFCIPNVAGPGGFDPMRFMCTATLTNAVDSGKLRLPLALLIAILLAALSHLPVGAGVDAAKWKYVSRINCPSSVTGIVQTPLTPEIMDLSNADLSDLRILNPQGLETPYVITSPRTASCLEMLESKIYNQTYVPGIESSVTVDFDRKVMKNKIEVETGGADFRRKLAIKGSDDGVNWENVRDAALLFRFQKEGKLGGSVERKTVELPNNDWRYLRLTVFNGPDDSETIQIQNVRSWMETIKKGDLEPVTIAGSGIVQQKGVTEIRLDLGYANMPLHGIKPAFSDKNFARSVTVQGRKAEEKLMGNPIQDPPALVKKVPVPWTHIADGFLFRYTEGDASEESLFIDLKGSQARYLVIRIKNMDDSPLNFERVHVTRYTKCVSFQAKSQGDYLMYFGNESVQAPSYDISHYLNRLAKGGSLRISPGNPSENPAFKSPTKELPWSERHKSLIWAALLVMMAVLGLLAFRMIRSSRQN